MLRMEATVDAQIDLIPSQRTREYASERGKLGSARLNREDTLLVVPLVAGEEENAIFANGAAELIAELLPLEERVWIAGIALKAWICGQVIVPVEIESAAVSDRCRRSG